LHFVTTLEINNIVYPQYHFTNLGVASALMAIERKKFPLTHLHQVRPHENIITFGIYTCFNFFDYVHHINDSIKNLKMFCWIIECQLMESLNCVNLENDAIAKHEKKKSKHAPLDNILQVSNIF